MVKRFLFLALICTFTVVSSQPKTYTESKYGKLEFGFFVPDILKPNKLYPMVVYLHGFGNNKYVYLYWYREDIQAKNPCFVFTPRTPVSWAENISKTPLWMFHGSAGDVNTPDLTERLYNRLVEIGATKMRYTNYPGFGHDIWNIAAEQPSWFDWMFSHSKPESEPSNAVEFKK